MFANRTRLYGMSDMLVNALVETGRFNVVERSQIEKLLNEQGMALEGLLQPGTGARGPPSSLVASRYVARPPE